MNDGHRLTVYVITWPSIIWATAGLGITAAALLLPDLDFGERLRPGVGGLAIASVCAVVIAKRAAVLRIGDHIEYRRLFLRLQVPLDTARRVNVSRKLSLYTPVFWDLVIDVAGAERKVPIAAHYWFGGHLEQRANKVARRLGVPVVDPVGDEWRSHRSLPMRVLGSGHEWALVIVPAAVIVAATLLLVTYG